MDVYVLVLVLWFTALVGAAIVIGIKVLTELQSVNRNLRNANPRPTSTVGPSAQHRRGD